MVVFEKRIAFGATMLLNLACSSAESSAPPARTCTPTSACTSVDSSCLALVDNRSSDTPGLRMSQISVTVPELLATGVVADSVADDALLNDPACNLAGKGTFNWLLQFDRKAGTLRTGAAGPSTPDLGYCFLSGMLGGASVDPALVDATLSSGSFDASIKSLAIPIYLDPSGDQYVLLPLSDVHLKGTLSPDYNCVGTYNAAGLDPHYQCRGDQDNPTFKNAGTAEGIITLEDADAVIVAAAGKSLCVLLSGSSSKYGDGGKPVEKCRRDGGGAIVFVGDWCSTTGSEGGCGDSARIGADFAASAVRIQESCGS